MAVDIQSILMTSQQLEERSQQLGASILLIPLSTIEITY
jgi:hypothetical protein